jgi:hypothetical protein
MIDAAPPTERRKLRDQKIMPEGSVLAHRLDVEPPVRRP